MLYKAIKTHDHDQKVKLGKEEILCYSRKQLKKLYPEGAAEARFNAARVKWIYAFCNRHGLYRTEAGKP